MQEKYKIGDIVRVRSDLKGDTRYYYGDANNAYLFFNSDMKKFCGHVYKITDEVPSYYPGYINYRLALGDEEREWVFSNKMLEPVQRLRSLICKRKS